MPEGWSGFSYIVTNLARFIRPDEVTFSGVNSTLPMLACLLAKRAYPFRFVYINVAGGVDPRPSKVPLSSSDPVLAEKSASIFDNEDFYDLCTRGGMDLCFLGAAQIDGLGRTNVSCIGDWHAPKVRLPVGGGGPGGVVVFGADGVVGFGDFVVGDVVGGFGEVVEVAVGIGEYFAKRVARTP